MEIQYPAENRGQGSLGGARFRRRVRCGRAASILRRCCGAGLLLVIACVNVSSLLLVRSKAADVKLQSRGALRSVAPQVDAAVYDGRIGARRCVGGALGLMAVHKEACRF